MNKFNEQYYQRYYFEPATRVADPAYFERLANFFCAYLDVFGCSIESVLDAGCGAGLMHAAIKRAWPQADISAFDASKFACERYGWQHATLETFASDTTFDLVICHDVVQYLDRHAAAKAITKLSELTNVALFFGVLTKEDWQENCDQELTDSDVHIRSARWYRQQLKPMFRNAGGGLYIKRDAEVVMYELESLG